MCERVYKALLEKILEGALVPGETIDRSAVKRELQVSLAPIMQALARLASEGLVEIGAGKSPRVQLARFEEVRGQFALRMAFERQAVTMTSADRFKCEAERLRSLAREVDSWPAKDPNAWPAEIAFHMALVDLAGCPMLSESYRRVVRRNQFFSMHSARINVPRQAAADQPHSRLIDSLCSGNRTEADLAFMKHFAGDLGALSRKEGPRES